MAFIHRLRQKRKAKHEEYRLIYVVADRKVSHSRLISTMDDIEAIDDQIRRDDLEKQEATAKNFPELERLKAHYSPTVAASLSMMLADILSAGIENAAQGMSTSTYYRRLAQLRAAGVLPETQQGEVDTLT